MHEQIDDALAASLPPLVSDVRPRHVRKGAAALTARPCADDEPTERDGARRRRPTRHRSAESL